MTNGGEHDDDSGAGGFIHFDGFTHCRVGGASGVAWRGVKPRGAKSSITITITLGQLMSSCHSSSASSVFRFPNLSFGHYSPTGENMCAQCFTRYYVVHRHPAFPSILFHPGRDAASIRIALGSTNVHSAPDNQRNSDKTKLSSTLGSRAYVHDCETSGSVE